MRMVIIVDQFRLSPYLLQQSKMTFKDLIDDISDHPDDYSSATCPVRVRYVEDNYTPDWCTTVFAENEQGMPFVWKSNWDSSG